MNNTGKINAFVGTILEVVGVLALTGMAIKSECKRHKTAVELISKDIELGAAKMHNKLYEAKIKILEEELAELKKEEAE